MVYDPGKGYNPSAPVAAGQGQTAVDAALTDPGQVPANTSGTSTASAKYYNQLVPGTRTLLEQVPGAGAIGQRWGGGKNLGQMQADLYQMGVDDTQSLVDLQTQLIQAGLLDPRAKQFALGSVTPGDPTDLAYTRLLSEAIKTGSDYGNLLSDLATNPRNTRGQRNYGFLQQITAGQKAGAGPAAHTDVLDLTDPAVLRDTAHAAFKDVTGKGRAQGDQFVEKFVQAFQGRQLAAQQGVNAAQDATAATGQSRAVTVSAPDASADASAFARSTDPAAAGAHDITKQFSSFLKLLGGVV